MSISEIKLWNKHIFLTNNTFSRKYLRQELSEMSKEKIQE